MKILLYFFARYLLAPLFVAVMIFVLTGIKTIKSKLSLKKLIIFILLASIAVSLPSLFGFLKNEYVWGGLTFTILSYILLGALFCKLSTSDLFGAIGIGSSRTAVILTLTTICALGGWCYYLLFELQATLFAMEHNKYPVVCNPVSDYVQQNPVPGHPASDIYPMGIELWYL